MRSSNFERVLFFKGSQRHRTLNLIVLCQNPLKVDVFNSLKKQNIFISIDNISLRSHSSFKVPTTSPQNTLGLSLKSKLLD